MFATESCARRDTHRRTLCWIASRDVSADGVTSWTPVVKGTADLPAESFSRQAACKAALGYSSENAEAERADFTVPRCGPGGVPPAEEERGPMIVLAILIAVSIGLTKSGIERAMPKNPAANKEVITRARVGVSPFVSYRGNRGAPQVTGSCIAGHSPSAANRQSFL